MTREDAEHRSLQLYPDIDWENTQLRQAYIQCWEDMRKKQTCGFCVEPFEKAKQKEVMYDGTLLRRSLLNQMHSFAIEVQKGEIEGAEFAKFAKKSIERLFEEEKAKQKRQCK